MAYEVAVRNPERYKGIIEVLYRYEGRILNDDNILDIYTDMYISGVVDSDDIDVDHMSFEQIKRAIIETKTHKADGGYPEGYQARFYCYLRTLSELGAIYGQYNEKLKISDVSKALLKGKISQDEFFALQSLRTNRKSPYRRVLNDFNYCKYLVQLIRSMPNQRISRLQFMVALFSDDGDVEEMKKILINNRFGTDYDRAYEFLVSKYSKIDDSHDKVAQQDTCFQHYGDTVLRVMLLTGFFSVENNNSVLLITLNPDKMGLFDSLCEIDFQLTNAEKEDPSLFYNKLGGFSNLYEQKIKIYRGEGALENADYNEFLLSISTKYNLTAEKVSEMLLEMINRPRSRDIFWFVQRPLKLELYVSLLLYLYYGSSLKVRPNYKVDSNGLPYSPAPGGKGDIEIFGDNKYCLVEVSLMTNRDQQMAFESANLFRHINPGFYDKKYMVFIAPYIHPDTEFLLQSMLINQIRRKTGNCNKFSFKPMTTDEFVDSISSTNFLESIEIYSDSIKESLRQIL